MSFKLLANDFVSVIPAVPALGGYTKVRMLPHGHDVALQRTSDECGSCQAVALRRLADLVKESLDPAAFDRMHRRSPLA